jgi:hypothetical protein
MKIFCVECDTETPLAANPWQCLAENKDRAITLFKNRNGLTDDTADLIVASEVTDTEVTNTNQSTGV